MNIDADQARLRQIADNARTIQAARPISSENADNDYDYGYAVGVESVLRYLCGDAPADHELTPYL